MFKKNNFEITRCRPQKIWSLDQVKNYLRVSHTYDDDLIKSLTETAINVAENFTSLCLLSREITFVSNLEEEKFALKYSPIRKLVSVSLGKANLSFALANDQYYMDFERSSLYLQRPISNNELTVKYIAGFKASAIPCSIKQGILLHVCEMYDREGESTSILSNESKNLYLPYKKIRV
ncbi:MAG: head-tail connector protein [Janthinobacterium lividum]